MLQQRARNSLAPVARMYRDIRNIPFAAYRVQAYVTNSGPMEFRGKKMRSVISKLCPKRL